MTALIIYYPTSDNILSFSISFFFSLEFPADHFMFAGIQNLLEYTKNTVMGIILKYVKSEFQK